MPPDCQPVPRPPRRLSAQFPGPSRPPAGGTDLERTIEGLLLAAAKHCAEAGWAEGAAKAHCGLGALYSAAFAEGYNPDAQVVSRAGGGGGDGVCPGTFAESTQITGQGPGLAPGLDHYPDVLD